MAYFALFSGCAQNKQADKDAGDTPVGQNWLAKAKSPYLLQHADNPVHWHEWGAEALKKAREENKPLLISIGYAACHWCHVMEHESFMDSTVAKIMNEHYVSIKIDREERPDIDQIYMDAAHLLTGRGGWPLNAFALPDGRPFYAGTYFPKDAWKEILLQIAEAYSSQNDKIIAQAERLTRGIKGHDALDFRKDPTAVFTKADYKGIYSNWKSMIDFRKGGFRRAPKFPLPVGWEFLLQYHYLTGESEALEAVTLTLDEMAKGGIYDQLGGGFARYATDENWVVPHFEKMLYDNGQLISLYAHAYQVTKNEVYAEVIRETLKFIARDMTDSKGGFYSSLNADSEGEEGKYYVWTQQEIDEVLDNKTAQLFSEYYQVKSEGNWEEGRNILYREESMEEFALKRDMEPDQWDQILIKAKRELLHERSKRVRPSTDDKILTSWNALMMRGYIEAYLALGEEDYLAAALKNARFLEENMVRENGRLWRNYKDGEAGIEAFLDDYALLANAYIRLYQATFDIHWLDLSRIITDYMIAHFQDEKSSMFFYTSNQSEALFTRKMEITDNVMPSSNAVMANNLYQLGQYFYYQPYMPKAKPC